VRLYIHVLTNKLKHYRSYVNFGRAKAETLTVREFEDLLLRHEFLSVSQRPNALQQRLSAISFDSSFPRVTIERYSNPK